ncbi:MULTISPECIES: putative pilus system protein FilF [Acinetobacter]|uniref:Protein FilF n=1 Tax=Acinetobacter corruptisaponis TaxID=3045147 RepID=A0ABY8S0Q1_9GAMM|nr:hypothetical protein [Acinetobacter sp. KCTC 92772]WHP05205.1 hypothetical protein QLH32_14425 [Acinetobacter sp. KCTC 92772]
MINKKILLPFALSTLAILMHGCGGESAKINEDPTTGVKGVTSSTSCDITADDCLQFALDYPVAGLNFDCSSDTANHFATKLDSNIVTGACKLGDTATFYIQGASSARKINLGTIKLDDISKLKLSTLPRIRIIDFATALTGIAPSSLSESDDTIRVAMALVKILQGVSTTQDNVVGDLQQITLTNEKKDQLGEISKDIGVSELKSGEYAEILKPWVDISQVTDQQAFTMLKQLLNISNSGVWQAELPIYKPSTGMAASDGGVTPDGFFGCNKAKYDDCMNAGSNNLLHSMGSFLLLSDRQGYTLGYGEQWRGNASISSGLVLTPYILTTLVKPTKIQLNAQNTWLNLISREINGSQPLRFNATNESTEDLLLTQGKLMNGATIAGTEAIYRQLIKDWDISIDAKHLGLWQQTIGGEAYRGVIDIYKVNPSSYLDKKIFTTEANVKSGKAYVFPLYATLTFKFADSSITPKEVNVGIVINENGDIRTDIKKDPTTTDMSGNCLTAFAKDDGTYLDTDGVTQYRIGTTGAALFSTNDKSVTVRMILSNPKFGLVDGALFGLNISDGTGAKINIHNLLDGQATGITLTNFANNAVTWSNSYAYYQNTYIRIYDDENTNKNQYVKPTDEERELAKRYSGTVSINIADQNIPACKAIKIKS